MRLVSFVAAGAVRVGLVEGAGLIDVARHLPDAPSSLKAILAEEHGLARLEGLLGRGLADQALDGAIFAPVVPDPDKIFLILHNYEAERIAQGRPKLSYPHLMTRFADSLVGHGQPLVIPRVTTEFDYEGELAAVIGRPGRAIAVETAMAHVAGYAAFNDCCVREFMRHTRHFTAGKNFPASAAFGPFLTTVDEAPDFSGMDLTTRLNGEVVQTGNPADFSFSLPELIAYISTFTPLRPGDVIATGSPGGAGHSRSPPRFLRAGDTIEVEIAGVGRLANPCVAET